MGADQRADDEPRPYQLTVRKPRVKKGESLWLMSFSDMSLILMSFFVLQLSFSTPDKRKYDNLSSAITKQQAAANVKPPDNLAMVAGNLKAVIREHRLEQVVDVNLAVDGLAVEFRDQALFEPGSAEPNAANRKTVEQLMALLAASPDAYHLVFEGHTDDVPTAGGKFHSNWELSAARAIALLSGFRARGVSEQRMTVQAFADTRPKVAVKGLTGDALKRARAANRRVVIRLQ